MSSCDWEILELRVLIFNRGAKAKTSGNFWGQPLWQFFNVSVDLKSLGINGFKGSKSYCDFKTPFSALVKLKKIPFSFMREVIEPNMLNFGNLQSAQSKKVSFTAAKLYVQHRDEGELISNVTGIGILLEGVTVITASQTNGGYY